MTQEQLNTAIDIESKIRDLKQAMADISRVNLFRTETGCNREAIPFLAKLHTEVIAHAVDKIANEINGLEKEFESL